MEHIRNLLIEFSAKSKELKSYGGPEKNGPLFEELLGLQERILNQFGLPTQEKYCQLLWEITDEKINDVTFPVIVDSFKKMAMLHDSPNENIGYIEVDHELALEAIKEVLKKNKQDL